VEEEWHGVAEVWDGEKAEAEGSEIGLDLLINNNINSPEKFFLTNIKRL